MSLCMTTGHIFVASEMKSSDPQGHSTGPSCHLIPVQKSALRRNSSNKRESGISAGTSYLISRLRIIFDVPVKDSGHMERSSSLRSFYMFWTNRHTKINSTSWRKKILETNGHWDSQLMGTKGWNSYWYAHQRPVGSNGVRGGHRLLWQPFRPNGKLSTELGRSCRDWQGAGRHRVVEPSHQTERVCLRGARASAPFISVNTDLSVSYQSCGILIPDQCCNRSCLFTAGDQERMCSKFRRFSTPLSSNVAVGLKSQIDAASLKASSYISMYSYYNRSTICK